MLDADTFLKNSPFQLTHGPSQPSDNTTPELLKFSLQEQYRNKLRELKDNHHDLPNLNLLHLLFLQDSFNSHLQQSLDDGVVLFDTTISTQNSNSLMLPNDSASSNNGGSPMSSFNNEPNFLNLKVLIENSVFDTKNVNRDSVLNLASLKQLKLKIHDRSELKAYLQSKYAVSQQFMSTMILDTSKLQELDIDTAMLLKVFSLNQALVQKILEVSEELEWLKAKLSNHNLACLVLGYVEDVKITSLSHRNHQQLRMNSPLPSPLKGSSMSNMTTPSREGGFTLDDANKDIEIAFESLFSHLASLGAKKSVVLPSPPTVESMASKIEWAIRCIDSIVTGSSSGPTSSSATEMSSYGITPPAMSPALAGNDKMLIDYKTALNDLRFSHQYLTKEYEYTRETSFKVIQEYKKKNTMLEREVSKLKAGIHSDSLTSITATLNGTGELCTSTQYDLAAKEREISRLRKELNAQKIDSIGPRTPLGMSPTHNVSSHSLLVANDTFDEIIDADLTASRPASSAGMSNGILRKEFKKIVGSIQDQYEVELSEERMRRRKLEEQLLRYDAQSH